MHFEPRTAEKFYLDWLFFCDKNEVFNQGGQELPDSSIMDGMVPHWINLEVPGQMHGGKEKWPHKCFFISTEFNFTFSFNLSAFQWN